jgi:uncharacterized protein (TIGR02145 family)
MRRLINHRVFNMITSHGIKPIMAVVIILFVTISCEQQPVMTEPDYTGEEGIVTDIEGNVYKTIGIGSQIWMAENLRSTRYNNGSPIPKVISDSVWKQMKTPAWCWYNNDSAGFGNLYGALYNFYAADSSSICPAGWHVPSGSEWARLETFAGGHDLAGGILKDFYSNSWNDPNICYVESYSFNALPGGKREYYAAGFRDSGDTGYWWTSTEKDTRYSILRSMSHENTILFSSTGMKREGYSIRCIKDPSSARH